MALIKWLLLFKCSLQKAFIINCISVCCLSLRLCVNWSLDHKYLLQVNIWKIIYLKEHLGAGSWPRDELTMWPAPSWLGIVSRALHRIFFQAQTSQMLNALFTRTSCLTTSGTNLEIVRARSHFGMKLVKLNLEVRHNTGYRTVTMSLSTLPHSAFKTTFSSTVEPLQ